MKFGGLPGIRDVALLESAIGRPYTGYYPRMHHKAAALAESMVRNHGFVDGNKRTSFLVLMLLIRRSGYTLTGLRQTPYVELERLILELANSHPPLERVVSWFKSRLVRL